MRVRFRFLFSSPHYADDVLCKFLMELLSTSDLIFTQGAELLKSYLQFECISTLNINSLLKFIHEVEKKKITQKPLTTTKRCIAPVCIDGLVIESE